MRFFKFIDLIILVKFKSFYNFHSACDGTNFFYSVFNDASMKLQNRAGSELGILDVYWAINYRS